MAEPAKAAGDHHCIPQDSVGRLVDDWHLVRPALDFTPVGVVTRLDRLRGHFDLALAEVLAEHGLTAPSFAVLVTLSRLNAPEGVSQRRLMDELGLTSGTVSVRMDRLEEAGLIERQPDESDRRNTRIRLTPAGEALFERVVPEHLDNERRLLASLSEPERELLAALLSKVLVEFEGATPPPDAPFSLGLALSPAHVTIAMRRAVGLPPVAGLLVRRVLEGSPAEAGGLCEGDVIVGAGRREINSVTALYAAIADAAVSGRLRLRIVRGTGRSSVTIRLDPGAGEPYKAATCGRSGHDEHVL